VLSFDAISEGKYDFPDAYSNTPVDQLIYSGNQRPILANPLDRLNYAKSTASWICGLDFRRKFSRHFLTGWLSVFPRKISLSPFSYKDFAFMIRGCDKIFKVNTILKSFDFKFSHRRVKVYETLLIEALVKLSTDLKKAFIHMVTGISLVNIVDFSCRTINPRVLIFIDQNYNRTHRPADHVQISADIATHKFTIEQYKTKQDLEEQLYAALSAHKQNRMQ
jgi:hypothetical protein